MLPTKKLISLCLGAALLFGAANAAFAAPKKEFKLAWSIYVGWMPWQWADETGIVKKWADKYGIKIDVVQFNDYVESINQYTAGAFDALTVTNMDTVAVPGVGGVDSTAVIIGDFSNGNDAVILKDKTSLKDVKGQKINLVQFSVSHYLLARALDSIGLKERDVTVVNTSDADMAAAFATPEVTAVTTWNPIVSEILKRKDAHNVFNSSQIPGEIMDLAIANTKTLEDNPDFGKALAGIWYETMGIMSANTPAGEAAREAMGKASGTDLAGFESQLKTTRMFFTPGDATAFAKSAALPKTTKLVNEFLFEHGLLGDNAKSAEVIGVKFPDGSVFGDPNKIGLRFVTTYMDSAAAAAKN
ncbi:ABC transporter periplasmic binding protein, urea carboxylase region [Methylocella silvestris BL2]|uniref:ABC transporter periplasmic binding protein, urea carboxylase region n=1 Tax=Methylocella silvestris (strain DSM 15510 / CIP 108128 / LMG 27833 / NCIMB 13906 / BL2) TaxID=395965 RepID=B8EQ34_METSB|nr:putative urea ABC transporter substrate-binding protein [Methylocella silvestris]ACK51524.1 ABC transporter periplasmic binding protein, urea carboxylase region [Methylocella silvestris BL2]